MKNLLAGKTLLAGSILSILAAANVSAKQESQQYIVKYLPGTQAQVTQAAQTGPFTNHDVAVVRELKKHNAVVMKLNDKALSSLKNNPNVQFVEADQKRYLLGAEEYEPGAPYGIAQVQADLVSDAAAGNQTICIIDSGYDLGHPDLMSGANVSGTSDPGTGDWFTDENSHGTHVAGTIAAIANGSGVIGVLPNGTVNLHIIKVFDAEGWAYSSSLIAAADACEAAGSNIISMSLGGSFSSQAEKQAFAGYENRGILSVAAAGNDGNKSKSYPASYDGVMSVAAVDSNEVIASFSQQNRAVEISGPGVGVLSTVPRGMGSSASVNAGGTAFDSVGMEGSPFATATGALTDCGLGESACADAVGKVCLIQRGNISFAEKVQACEAGGGAGAIIYNNEAGPLNGTLGETVTSIPSVGVTDTDGAALLGLLGSSTTVSVSQSDHAYFDGTSMATPHVSAVAALVWSHFPSCTAAEIRSVLQSSAKDLGSSGKDNAYGYGLVQAKAAYDMLSANPALCSN